MQLENKVALITGASSGIGHAIAHLFAQEGARVVLTARRQAALDTLVAEINASGGEAIAVVGDVQDESNAQHSVAVAVEHFGQLDIAINNAGTLGTSEATPQQSLEAWHHTLNTNLTSAFLGAKHQLPALQTRAGSLVFTGSFVGHTVGMPHTAAYAASKAGIVGLTQSLAAEFGPVGVRVNALLPGGTDTPMAQAFADTPETLEFVRNLHALKRLAKPEEIAKSALYLASDASSFTTGTAMLVDGGVSINRT